MGDLTWSSEAQARRIEPQMACPGGMTFIRPAATAFLDCAVEVSGRLDPVGAKSRRCRLKGGNKVV